ncbi:MAG: prefoldin subunit beta [Nitrososphaerales archaeon]|nr:prefoldin subunit beta [Nitrososphaerales archaeon]
MSREEIPPWLREQLVRFEQLQQNLQAILLQKQQVELELAGIEKAISELKKIGPNDVVYKSAGPLLIRVKRDSILSELEEKRELANTRVMVLAKQESRVRESVRELQMKIDEAIRGKTRPSESQAS